MARLDFNATNVPTFNEKDEAPPVQHARVWSPFQTNVFDFVEHGTGNAIVEAVAGSGKTTTIVEAMKRVRGSTLFLAFNKSIATELQNRGVNAKTFHSLTYSPVMRAKRQNQVEMNKLRKLCDQIMTGDEKRLYGAFAQKLVGLARQLGVGFLVADVETTWMDIVLHHDIEPDNELADLGTGIEWARKLLDASNESPLVDFDDMLYFAVKDGLSLQKYDFVFVDEAQDTNAIQRAILKKVMHDRTRLIAVGDPAQAIYGFRGADSNSLSLIARDFQCITLPLSISYRCPVAVVNYARQWVQHIQPSSTAEDGVVAHLGTDWKTDIFQANDLVVCRTTKPVVQLAYRLLRARVPVRIMGKEIGQGLKNLINKMRAFDLESLENNLLTWCAKEVEKAKAKMEDSKAEATQDKVDAILCLLHGLHHGAQIFDLMQTIDSLFAEGVNQVILSTIHKAKGLEADRVFWLNSDKCPPQWVRGEWQLGQEDNLCYVAVTRAKKELYTIQVPEER